VGLTCDLHTFISIPLPITMSRRGNHQHACRPTESMSLKVLTNKCMISYYLIICKRTEIRRLVDQHHHVIRWREMCLEGWFLDWTEGQVQLLLLLSHHSIYRVPIRIYNHYCRCSVISRRQGSVSDLRQHPLVKIYYIKVRRVLYNKSAAAGGGSLLRYWLYYCDQTAPCF